LIHPILDMEWNVYKVIDNYL